MKSWAIGIVAAAAVAQPAGAEFTGIIIELVSPWDAGWTEFGYLELDLHTYRIYATFDSPASTVTWVGDAEAGGDLLRLRSGDGLFVNAPTSIPTFNSMLPPTTALTQVWPELEWDTFVTIGATMESEPVTRLTDGFAAQAHELSGNFALDGNGWFVDGRPEQATASDGIVLLAQVTVSADEGITGENWTLCGTSDGTPFCTTVDEFTNILVACDGDLDGDYDVSMTDLTALLSAWGSCDEPCEADLADFDGVVGFRDLVFLLQHWGDCFGDW